MNFSKSVCSQFLFSVNELFLVFRNSVKVSIIVRLVLSLLSIIGETVNANLSCFGSCPLQAKVKKVVNMIKICFIVRFSKIATNVSGLCDGGAIEAQIFNFAQKLNRRTTVELCSFAPLSQSTHVKAVISFHPKKM